MVLRVWTLVAAVVLLLSLAAHFSTFLGIDPMEAIPGVMFIHVLIFPPFGAAIYYARKTAGSDQAHQTRVMKTSPRWLRLLTTIFGAYAVINFIAFTVFSEGGVPQKKNGKFMLHSHGRLIREMTEAEYHKHQAYVVRGFSGHWMLFSSAALMMLVGADRMRNDRRTARDETAAFARAVVPPPSPPPPPPREADPEPTTPRAGLTALFLYVCCLAMIFSGRPVLGVVSAVPVIGGAVLAFRRRRGFPHAAFESCIGCLLVFPNAFIASKMGNLVAEFIYLLAYVGPDAAINHSVGVTFPKAGPSQLTNGLPLNNRVWSALMILVMFPLFAFGTIGLSYLAEQVGRLLEVRRKNTKA